MSDERLVTIHYDGHFAHQATVECDCGHRFPFQSKPKGYCPNCGGKIDKYIADNIPFDKIPDGYKYYLLNEEKYRKAYLNDEEWWGRLDYLAVIYNDRTDKINKSVFEGWCFENGYEPIFYRKTKDNFYMGYENTKGTFVKISGEKFKDIIQQQIEKIKQGGSQDG